MRLLKNSATEPSFFVAFTIICAKQAFRRIPDDYGSANAHRVVVLLLPLRRPPALIDEQIDLSFVRERVKGLYSATGRPSIDSEVLLRLLLRGHLYGITSERRLLEKVRMHLAYRWFTRLDFEQEIPDHSTFSKAQMTLR